MIGSLRGFSLQNYVTLFTTPELMEMIIGTITLAVVVAVISTVLGTMGAIGAFYSKKGMNNAIPFGYAPLLDVTVDNKGVFQKGKIHSFVQRQGKGPILDPKHGAAVDIDRLSKIDFPDTRPNISPTGEISKR